MPTPNSGLRAHQAQMTRARILKAATRVFSQDGFSGGRIEKISRLAKSNDRMIYYYFKNKEQLFISVLEGIYAGFNEAESRQRFELDDPVGALRQLIEFVWHYYIQHPEFISILNTENLHKASHSRKSPALKALSGEALGNLAPIIHAGQAQGVFRADVDIHHTYLLISSLCYFYHSNQHPLGAFLGIDLASPQAREGWLAYACDQVLRGLRNLPAGLS
ncbi:TetR/AcrR family transcriptional regulator [Pseudomonas eucalypticola]|uniref:TetR/AcrR family transcriptional regulator n=1 Tax=Pseudomonas eucalypticola TaxID=2599595 RepID=A0A7D5H0E2_9PSED|nr:TetR/AcrR family transcriptional regulator [Pseudomonas eucalypticola]QKZ04625.1 TetR/AcrR family transcriptional regulator [Pseudomonas eucalypticola]